MVAFIGDARAGTCQRKRFVLATAGVAIDAADSAVQTSF